MTDSEFEALTDRTLAELERAFEASAPDALAETHSGVLKVEFDNGTQMIVNRHGAAREIWVAARSGGHHFRYDGTAWRDTRDGSELFATVSRLASAQSETPVVLRRTPG